MNSSKSKAHDLFLLMFNLSQLTNKVKIIDVFVTALKEIWSGITIIFLENKVSNSENTLEIFVSGSLYGYLEIKNISELENEDLDLIHNSVGMLAVILKKIEQDALLADERLHLQELVDKKILEIKESEEKFKNVFEHSVVGMSMTTIGGKLLANSAMEHILGYSKEELSKLTWQQITYADDIERDQLNIQSLISGENASLRWEKRYIHKLGHVLWVDISSVLQRDSTGKPQYFITTIVDITERKKAEEKTRESKILLQASIESPKDMIILSIDKNYRYLYFNSYHKQVMNSAYNVDVKIGMNLLDCITNDEDKVKSKNNYDRALKGESHLAIDEFGENERSFYETRYNPIFNEKKEVIGATAFSANITARKLAENALRESERKLREAQEMAHLGFWFWKVNTGEVEWSEEVYKIFRLDPNQFSPHIDSILAFSPWPEDHQRDQEIIDHAIANHEPGSYEQKFLRPDKSIGYYFSTFQGNYDENGTLISIVGTVRDITERKLAEEALYENEQIFNKFMEYSPIYVFFKDENIRTIRLSKNFETMLGMPMEDLLGKNMYELFPTELAKSIDADDRKILEDGKEITVEENFNGHYYTSIKFPIHINGKPRYLAGFTIDITERKKSEEALRKSEEQLKFAHSGTNDGIWDVNMETGSVYISPRGCEILGYKPDEHQKIADKWHELVHPDDLAATNQALVSYLKGETPIFVIEQRLKTATDDWIWILTRGKAVEFGSNGRAIRMVGTHTDITQRKQIEEALSRHTERLRNLHIIDQAILEAIESPEAVVQTALQYMRDLLHCQRASVGIFDLEKKEVRVYAADIDGKTIVQTGKILNEEAFTEIDMLRQHKLVVVEDISRVDLSIGVNTFLQEEGIQACINVALVSALEMYGVLNIGWENPKTFTPEEKEIAGEVAGQITIAIEKARLLKETKRYALELEQRVEDRTFQLLAANKELEAFSYSISHDLRAPLRHISGFIQLFLEEKTSQLTEQELGYLNIVTNSVEEMGKLIDALLSFSRLSRSELLKMQINTEQLINQSLLLFDDEIKARNMEIKISEVPKSYGDYQLIGQVWTNLISNAIKYTGKKDKAIIEIGSRIENNETIFFIKDNGAGFNMKYAGKLFGVFQRLHKPRDFEGIGIGLANINRIITRHGGRCWAEGETGKGATFYFSLPQENGA